MQPIVRILSAKCYLIHLRWLEHNRVRTAHHGCYCLTGAQYLCHLQPTRCQSSGCGRWSGSLEQNRHVGGFPTILIIVSRNLLYNRGDHFFLYSTLQYENFIYSNPTPPHRVPIDNRNYNIFKGICD
jgi:hypothetical protein